MELTRRLVFRWVLGAFLLGLSFPLASWVIAAITSGDRSVFEAHAEQPALWVVNIAPIILAIVGAVVGGAHAQLARLQRQTEDLAERVAHEWTAEIHDNNVATAKAAELRSKYFAALSHDMRTPITAISGFASLARENVESLDDQAIHGFMADIEDCADQLLDIVNDLMDAAKLEAGKVELQVEDVDGDEIAESVVGHMRALADEEHLDMTAELGAETPVRADPQRFRQILVNLVSNALKYTDQGEVIVRSYADNGSVFYEVEDTGAGISPMDMPKVFTAFEQTDVAKGRADSTGLGLPVSLGMAKAMGGTITCVSLGVGHGSTFRLELEAGTGGDTELRMAELPALIG